MNSATRHVPTKSIKELDDISFSSALLNSSKESDEYDVIWACASLLHVKEKDLQDVMERLKRLLKPEGILYASFKEGMAKESKMAGFSMI